MQQLATAIRGHAESLVDQYDARLRTMAGYSRLPESMRRELERHVLDLIAQCLETADASALVEYVGQRASQWAAMGLDLTWFQQALTVLEDILVPLIDSAEASTFLWQALNRSQSAVWQMVAERAHKAEQALRDSQQLLQTVMDNIPQAIFWKDKHLVYLGCNRAFAADAGLTSPGDVIGKTDWDMPWKEQAELYRTDDGLVMESGTPKLDYEEPQTTPDGSTIWLRTSKVPMRDTAGNVNAVLGMYEDITERKHAEEALRQSQQLLQTVMDNIPQAIFWKDRNLTYLGCNRAFAEDAGLASPTEIVGKTDYDMPWQPQADLYRADDSLVMESGTAKINYEEPQTTPTGEQTWLSTSKVPMRDTAGTVTAVLGMYEDITERKRVEAVVHESQQRLSLLVQQSPLAVIEWNMDYEVVEWNPAAEQIFGYTREEVLGHHTAGFLVPEKARQQAPQAWQDLLAQKGTAHGTSKNLTKDGRLITCDWYNTPLVGADGNVIGVASLAQDITERRRMERQIQESLIRRGLQVQISTQVAQEIAAAPALDELFRRVVTLIKERFGYYHAQIFRYDPNQDTVVLVSGYGTAGQHMLAEGHKLQMRRGVVGAAAASGESILAADVAQDGDWRPNPHLPDTKGELAVPIKFRDQVLGILDVQSDQVGKLGEEDRLLLEGLCGQIAIAIESRQAEEAIREEQRRSQAILETTTVPMIISRLSDSKVLYANQALAQFRHMVLDELIGSRTTDYFVNPDDRNKFVEVLRRQGYAYDFETQLRGSGEVMSWVLLSARIINFQNETCVLSSYVDITERKQAEARLQELLNNVQQSEQLMRTVIDSTPDWIFIKDQQHRYRLANKGYADALHSRPEDFIGKNDLDLGFPEELVKGNPDKGIRGFWADDRLVMNSGETQVYANDPATIDGVVHIFNTIKTPLRDTDGKIWGVLAFARDITERERLMAEQQKRALQLQTAAEVSRAASSILSLDELLPQAAELVRARFNLYYVGIFLVDESGQWAVLRAGTGEAGQQMLTAGHKLKVGGSSMISWCIVNRQARIALDVGEEAVRFDNPLLPLTRSEAALPLISRGSVIGAVTIQSDQQAAFTAEDITALQTMADQISNATENARLFEQAQAALKEVDAINRRLTGEAWESYLRHRSSQQVIWVSDNDESAPAPLLKADETLSTGQIVIEPEEDKSQATVTAPIMLRGQTIGALRMQTSSAEWNEDVQTILTSIAGHIAQAAENTRLLEETERFAHREQRIREITTRIRAADDIQGVLEATATELAQSMGVPRAIVRLTMKEDA